MSTEASAPSNTSWPSPAPLPARTTTLILHNVHRRPRDIDCPRTPALTRFPLVKAGAQNSLRAASVGVLYPALRAMANPIFRAAAAIRSSYEATSTACF
jgi:hypothetical protein